MTLLDIAGLMAWTAAPMVAITLGAVAFAEWRGWTKVEKAED